MSSALLRSVVSRRTNYNLTNKSPIPQEKIQEIVKTIVKNAPTSFNVQSIRAIVVTPENHQKLWGKANELAKADDSPFAPKLELFSKAYGTVLFFDHLPTVEGLKKNVPELFHSEVALWAANSNGYAQISTWAALHAEGLGASLQHYHPYIVNAAKEIGLTIPEGWALRAQLVFGEPTEDPLPKTFLEEDTVLIY
ncbi:BA75_02518T0 [Komagataella pastoris]|uniref:BA75_02518T0 n=1 Tax=Komagataella pastoris TaxID=4922 RepID=A0A1B2JC26_PICPA|nr:BA75_02518T0 [Komagataella pastoris]